MKGERKCHDFVKYSEEKTDRCWMKWQNIKKEATDTAETKMATAQWIIGTDRGNTEVSCTV